MSGATLEAPGAPYADLTATEAQIRAFAADPRPLSRIEWRDEAGRLVARTLGAACTLVKWAAGQGTIAVTVHPDAAVVLLGLGEPA